MNTSESSENIDVEIEKKPVEDKTKVTPYAFGVSDHLLGRPVTVTVRAVLATKSVREISPMSIFASDASHSPVTVPALSILQVEVTVGTIEPKFNAATSVMVGSVSAVTVA